LRSADRQLPTIFIVENAHANWKAALLKWQTEKAPKGDRR
jgi:hypothetical protein